MGKSYHFCPTALSVPTSFGGRSNSSSISRTIENNLRTRNVVRMTGTKNRTTRRRGLFDPRSRPFGPLSPTLMVVPTSLHEDHSSFHLVLKLNVVGKRQISVFGLFSDETWGEPLPAERVSNDPGTSQDRTLARSARHASSLPTPPNGRGTTWKRF